MEDQNDGNPDRRNELAEVRTHAAHRRTELANERTFSAWVRTGLALLVTGFAATQLLNETGPSWLLTLAGLMFVGLGAATFVIAYWSYHKTSNEARRSGPAGSLFALLTLLLVAVSGIAVFLMLNASP